MQTAITSKNIFQKPYEGFRFSMKFARLATTLALLFCVCGAMSATDYYWDTTSTTGIKVWTSKSNWKIFSNNQYTAASDSPTTGDNAYFGTNSTDASAPNMASGTTYNITTAEREIDGLYVNFSDNTQNTSLAFTNSNTELKITKTFEIRKATGLSYANININTRLTMGDNANSVNITIPSGVTLTVGRGAPTTINGNVTIENGGSLVANGTLNVTGTITNNGTIDIGNNGKIEGKIKNNADGTINIGDGTLDSNGAWSNNGKVNVNGNANITLPPNAANVAENGTWIYNATRTLVTLPNGYNNLQIGDGTNMPTVTLGIAGKVNGNLTVKENATLDLEGNSVTVTNTITNEGTIRLHGTASQNITGTVTNGTNSTVEFYGNTGSTKIEVSKMASRVVSGGVTFSTLKCDLSGSTDAKVLDFTDVTYIGTLDLKGNTTNKLGITANPQTTITLGTAGVGQNLQINYHNVILQSNQFDVSDGTSVATNQTFTNTETVYNNQNGWLFPAPPYTSDVYYWVGGGGDWSDYTNHWRYDSAAGTTAQEAPGTRPNAEVHIEPTAATTVTLNASLANPIKDITINSDGTLDIPSGYTLTTTNSFTNTGGTINLGGTLNANATWNNTGTVNVNDTNAAFSSRTVAENGTWTYTAARTGLVPITYNVLELHGSTANTTIELTAAVTANSVSINGNTTLALGAYNLTVRGTAANSWTNNGTVTVTSGNVMFTVPAIDSGEWTYNNTSSRSLINLTYKDLNLSGTNTNTITPIADVSATGKITIGNNTTFDLANRNLSAAIIENNGTVRLHGTQNVSVPAGSITNDTNSTVEFYGNTGGSSIDVSKMGTSYGNLTITGNKNVAFPNTPVSGNLILKGANDNAPLTITTTAASATINVATSQQPNEGQYLRIDRAKVTISGSPFEPNTSYYARNSYDTDETTDDALLAVRNGWKIDIPIQLTNMLLSVAPLGGNTVYVRAEQSTMDGLSSVPSGLIANMLKRFFRIYESTGTSPAAGITVTNASLVRNSSKVTWIRLSLSGLGGITVADLQKYYVRTYTNHPSATSPDGFHPISDFAVGAVNPLFAYDNRYADDDANWQANAQNNNVAIRNWDANQGNNGSLLIGKDITMSVRTAGGMGTPIIYLSTSPDSGSQSAQYNGDTGSSWRVWLPNVTGVNALTATANNSFIGNSPATAGITVTGSSTNPTFNFSSSSLPWKDGDQITFMFGVTDTANAAITVGGNHSTTSHPLYALRLRDASDINSLDLWSFRLRGMNESQRGSVSIRNNVLNTNTGEQVSIEVVMPETGMLNVMVMTLDGRIVKYLQHGEATEGKHAYHWDGKDNSGKPVARGMYFVRVVGTGLDETRKVMAVRQ